MDHKLDFFSSIKDRKQIILMKFNWQKVASCLFCLPAWLFSLPRHPFQESAVLMGSSIVPPFEASIVHLLRLVVLSYDASVISWIQIVLKTWENMQLPTDPISMDTICIFSQEESSDSWALLCDPQRIAITWVLTMLGQTTLVKYKVCYQETLSKCFDFSFPAAVNCS